MGAKLTWSNDRKSTLAHIEKSMDRVIFINNCIET